ncbi:MAG: hypothetical protein OCC45_01505 [Desulfotalea sp.]
MTDIEKLKEDIEKIHVVVLESKENYDKNPDDFSAQLLLLSTENHLADLLKKLDNELVKLVEQKKK